MTELPWKFHCCMDIVDGFFTINTKPYDLIICDLEYVVHITGYKIGQIQSELALGYGKVLGDDGKIIIMGCKDKPTDYVVSRKTCGPHGVKHPLGAQNFELISAKSANVMQKPMVRIESFLETYGFPGARVLDHGMGTGTRVRSCMRLGLHYEGVDDSQAVWRAARAQVDTEYDAPYWAGL